MKETANTPEEILFEQAVSIGSAGEREAFLERCCRGNPELRTTLDLLLEGYFGGEGFLREIPEVNGKADGPVELGDRYALVERIGEGGFGEVWLAEQLEPIQRRVAVKILKRGLDTRQVIARFEAERQALALMDHPNIARIFDAGATRDGRPFFAMEWVRGVKITEYCAEHRHSVEERLNLFILVCQAIQHAHQKGIIHRDIKPSNVLVTMQDEAAVPKVIDFGIAKATQQGLTDKTVFTYGEQLIGTPAYISPEQALVTSGDIDTRSDIYSLGVLLYELLTGRPPFENQELLTAGIDEMRRIIREKEAVRPSVVWKRKNDAEKVGASSRRFLHGGDLDWIVMKCLEKDRERRYQTANGLAMDVRRYLAHEPIVARPPSAAYRFSKLVRRNPVVAGLAALLFLAMTTATVVGIAMNVRLGRAKAETDDVNRRLSDAVRLFESEKMEALASEGRRVQPMAWLARRLRINPADRASAGRLVSMLNQHSYALPLLAPLQHESMVNTAMFSSNGREILTTTEEGKIRFWDAQSGRLERVVQNGSTIAIATYLSGGTRLVVTSHDRVARVYETTNDTTLFEVADLRDARHACLEGGKGAWLFVQDRLNGICRWDLRTGTRLEPRIEVPAAILQAVYSEEVGSLAVLCEDRNVYLYNPIAGASIAAPRRFSDSAFAMTFTPDGKRLLVSASNDKRVAIWEYESSKVSEFVGTQTINSMMFCAGGKRLLTWTWGTPLQVWDAANFQPIGAPIALGLHARCMLSHDGRRVASQSQDGTTLLIDVEHGRVLLEPLEHEGGVETAGFSADDTRLVTGSVDGTARVWDVRMRSPESPEFPVSKGGGTAVFDHSGKRVVMSVARDAVQVCDGTSAQPIGPVLRHPGAEAHIRYAWFSPDDARLLTVGEEGLLRVWDAGKFVAQLDLEAEHGVMLGKFSPDGRFVVAANVSGLVTVWDANTGKRLARIDHNGKEVTDLDFAPNGSRFMTAAVDGMVRCWNLPNGEPIGATLKHRGIVWSVRYSSDGERVLTGSADKTAQVWNARTGQAIGKAMRHSKDVFLAIFSPDGERVLTTSEDGTARVWNSRNGRPISPFLRHKARIWRGAFSPDGKIVATGSDDWTVRLWDPDSGLPMTGALEQSHAVGRVAFSPDGARLLTFGGHVKLWDVIQAPTPVPSWFCDLVEALAGFRQAEDGQLIPVPPDAITVARGRAAAASNDFYSRWAKWFLVDRMQDPVASFHAN